MSASWQGGSDRRWRQVRSIVLANNPPCALCGRPGANSVDHKTPLHLGGSKYDLNNCQPAHMICNARKGARVQGSPKPVSRTKWRRPSE